MDTIQAARTEEPMEDWETTAAEDLAEAETAVAATDWVAADLAAAE